jgi:hypothetical protein
MSSRVAGWWLVGCLAAVLAGGCAETPPPRPVTIAAPDNIAPEGLRWAILAGLAARGWTIRSERNGVVQAQVLSQGTGDYLIVHIQYGEDGVRILSPRASGDPRRHARWLNLLSSEILARVAELGMGRVPPPPPNVPPPPPAALVPPPPPAPTPAEPAPPAAEPAPPASQP